MQRMKYSYEHITDPIERSRAIIDQGKILIEMSNGLKEASRMVIEECREQIGRPKAKWDATPKVAGDANLSDGN